MLKYELIHPEIIGFLAGAGHGARVLIADANFPASTKVGPNTNVVYLDLSPGIPTATQVLQAVLSAVNVEEAAVMQPEKGGDPTIFAEFQRLLPPGMELKRLDRFAFYEAVMEPDTALIIQTGEQRLYANILLTLGVVAPK
ncbi:RbsD or FucU transport [bacterium (candidate division B38) B3_B38]|nr:MAG: RbsD or FucU transport [bacterium (candidate division B38) B3_B38]